MARILIIEDEWLIAEDLRMVLRKLGHEVLGIVRTGEEAIRLVFKEIPDLIFMDVQLDGDIDGIDAAKSIRKKFNMPIIYCTANTDDLTVMKMDSTSPKGLVMKPFNNCDIERAITPFLFSSSLTNNINDKPKDYCRVLTAN